ncbi:hypothetical protein [Microvirga sp. M2]|uniref:hypothetical protein n=1 Tax=Microvirga sp. M2 TaxID=3073270 RepID=UPI0039C4B5E7
MRKRPKEEPVTEERLERALVYVAYVMERHGGVYLPIFERLEKELANLRSKNAALDRARKLLAEARAKGKIDF